MMAEMTIPVYDGPALSGSSKQVAWARTIRDEKMWLAAGYARRVAQRTGERADWSEHKKALYNALGERACAALGAHQAAAWWIERARAFIEDLVEDERRALFAAMSADEKARIKAL